MKLGAMSFMTDYSIHPSEFAAELEAHGYESMWAGDHSHIPVAQSDVHGVTSEALPAEYWHLMDPMIALSFAAAVTSRLRLGTGVALITQRDPITTAKEVATLDCASKGRFLFGVGAGWNAAELRNHGTDPAKKWLLMRERVEAIRAIWAHEVAEYHGQLVDFSPLMSWPKPVQVPGPPVLIGGDQRNLDRVVAYGDGWAPSPARLPEGPLVEQIVDLNRRAEAAGRDPIPVTVFRVLPVKEMELGSPLEMSEHEYRYYERAGADRVVVMLPPWRERMLPLLERYCRFIDEADRGAEPLEDGSSTAPGTDMPAASALSPDRREGAK
jgi:probable F420-dependent oxidoreductase